MTSPTPEPRYAAAAILVNGDGADAETLFIRRSDKLRFMPGHHAFPGGRIDPGEPTSCVNGAPDEDEAVAIHAAVREVFEETGILCVRGQLPRRDTLATARRAHLAGELEFDQILEDYGLHIEASEFTPAGLWITPKMVPIRFHTRYYLHRFTGEPWQELIEGEVDEVAWHRPAAMRRRWRSGEVMLPAPVAFVLQHLAELPCAEALAQLRKTAHVTPDTPGRIEYQCGINVIPLRAPALPPSTHTNCIAIGEREIILIDPGSPYPDQLDLLAGQIDELVAGGGRLIAVIASHAHPDHIGGIPFVRDRYGVPVWAHKATAGRVDFRIDRKLADGERITLSGDPDWVVRCLHTPGHDPGHLCFIEESTRTLLVCDMIAQQGSIIVSADHGGDMTQYIESLKRLKGESFDSMIPAHGFSIVDPLAKIQEYIDHRVMREDKVKAALAEGRRTLDELVASAYDDTDPKIWPLAKHSLKAHLIRLGVEIVE